MSPQPLPTRLSRCVPHGRSLAAGLAAAALLAACSSGGPITVDKPAAPQAAPVVSSLGDFPDPFLFTDAGTTYAFATNTGSRNVQVASSSDGRRFTALPDAMPVLAPWAAPTFGLTWAPEVIRVGTRYLLYYTGRDRASNKQCIGVAEGTAPAGPYTDQRSAPLVCQVAEGGSIDPSPWRDGSGLYLYVKNDGNCCNLPTSIYAVPLADDGLGTRGAPVKLITNDPKSWEHAVVEAPTMWQRGGQYLLFYSGGDYGNDTYAVGYASCSTPLGPCTKNPANPILKTRSDTTPRLIGPGHQSLIQSGSQTWIAYHAWEVTPTGNRGQRRFLHLDKLDWVNGQPVVRGPTMVP